MVRYEIQGNTAPASQDHIIIKQIQDGNIHASWFMHAATMQKRADLIICPFRNLKKNRMVRVENAQYAQWDNDDWIMYNGVLYDLSQPGTERMMKFDSQVPAVLIRARTK